MKRGRKQIQNSNIKVQNLPVLNFTFWNLVLVLESLIRNQNFWDTNSIHPERGEKKILEWD
jgi:hypothetical protein